MTDSTRRKSSSVPRRPVHGTVPNLWRGTRFMPQFAHHGTNFRSWYDSHLMPRFGLYGMTSNSWLISRSLPRFGFHGAIPTSWHGSRLLPFALCLASVLSTVAPPATAQAHGPAAIARLRYDGGGDWYANPSSLPNLLAAVRERTGISTADRDVPVGPGDPALRDYPFLYMTGHGNVRFSPDERLALRRYLLAGGFLHADDNYGMDESFRREIARVFPDKQLVELPQDHPIFRAPYEFPDGLPKVHEHDGAAPQAFGIFHQGRLVVIYTYETDLGDGWEDPDVHEDSAETREAALRMGVNIFVFALAQAAWSS